MKIRTALFAVLAATLSLHAATTSYDLSHTVAVTPGRMAFQGDDSITIDGIYGSSDKIAPGIYKVDGHYTLASRDTALLAIWVTNGDTAEKFTDNQMTISRGSGNFTLYLHMGPKGDPHVSFYAVGAGGSSFGGIYFNGADAWSLKPKPRPVEKPSADPKNPEQN